MATSHADTTVSSALRRFLLAPLRPQTYRNLCYLLVGLPTGLAYVVWASAGLGLGLGLLPVVVGVAVLGVVVLLGLLAASFERWLAGALVGAAPDPRGSLSGASRRERLVDLATDWRTWSPLVALPLRFVAGTAALLVPVALLSTGFNMLLLPLYYDQPGVYVGLPSNRPVELHPALYIGWNNLLVGFETVVSVGFWRIETLAAALAVGVVGAVLCLLGLGTANWLARASAWVTVRLVGDSYSPVAAVRRDQPD